MAKPKPHLQKSFIKEALEKKTQVSNLPEDNFVVSFQHLDTQQGETPSDWQENGFLDQFIYLLQGYSHATLISQVDNNKFTIYGGFPSPDKTDFTFPAFVPEDARWVRIHLNGTHCIIGHVVKSTFYLVFLDGNHSFWKSEKKNT